MAFLVFLALLVGAGLLGYQLGRRDRSPVRLYEPPRKKPAVVVPLHPTDARRELAEAAQELGRWMETASKAPEEVSPGTWDRIADASSRIARAAGRLSTPKD